MPPFISDIRQFATPAALAAYLDALPPANWPGAGPVGSTGHNTYRPTEAQWAGKKSMESMRAGYVAKGWSAGPHFFLALGSPNKAHDGIWQMTSPEYPGVHGVVCNATHFGIELVGDFQSNAPSVAQQTLFLDTIATLHRWAKIGPVFNMHRDCVPRTCPGDAFYALKATLQAGLSARLQGAGFYVALAPMWISETPGPFGPIALQGKAVIEAGEVIEIDEVKNGIAHAKSGVGFLPIGGLRKT